MIDPGRAPEPGRAIVVTDEFDAALSHLHSGHNLFLTGRAGTGKSTLIRHFLAETEHPTLVAAPTGIAALNVGGYTIHRVFGFHPGHTTEHIRSRGYRPGRFADALAGVHTLILDEASMIRADVFDMIAIALDRFGPDPTLPFGGVQVVLVGDLFQLPPVVTAAERPSFEDVYPTPYFFSAERYSREEFPTIDLTHVFRQSGDPELTAVLNTIREGTLVGRARAALDARTDPVFEPPDDEFWLTLTTTNRMANSRNRRRLERLPGGELTMTATTTGDLTGFDHPTDEVLSFKVGAQIMMLTNDPADRWVNGSIGRILDVTLGRRGDRGERGPVVIVEFAGGEVAEVAMHTWDATRPVTTDSSLRHETVGRFTQLPFTLAWAITIHKSQGQTLERLVVDLTGGTFVAGQLYVALSRCTSLAGLVLTRPVHPADLRTDRRITRFLRAPDPGAPPRRYCAIAALTVGEQSARSGPRPVELAVAFCDGTAVSTLVNPGRDLADARVDYGITASDVLLAPTLLEAWSMIAPLLDGHTPVGVGVDRLLGSVHSELTRLGGGLSLPPGVDIPAHLLSPGERARTRSGSAIERARTALDVRAQCAVDDPAAGAFEFDPDPDPGMDAVDGPGLSYLLSRDADLRPPTSAALPQLSAMLELSGEVGAVLLDRPRAWQPAPAADNHEEVVFPGDRDVRMGARTLVADQLRTAARRAQLDAETVVRLGRAGGLLGVDITSDLEVAATATAHDVLSPGARVCFTGSALDSRGRAVSRDQLESLAVQHGLIPVAAMTKSRCDVLVVAETASQSSKSRAARRWGKSIITVAEFRQWAHS